MKKKVFGDSMYEEYDDEASQSILSSMTWREQRKHEVDLNSLSNSTPAKVDNNNLSYKQ